MKVAVLGATGMLGSMLVDYLSKHFELVITARKNGYKAPEGVNLYYLDVNKYDDDWLTKIMDDCDWVINAIGVIKQRFQGRLNAREAGINWVFPNILNIIAAKKGCRIIQIATDCVYSGTTGNYNELNLPIPLDTYGFSKLKGEVNANNFYNIRCSIIGVEPEGSYSLLGWFLSQQPHSTINGYINHIWNGVTTLHFAKVCQGIIDYQPKLPNLQHLVPANSINKYELLKLFVRTFGMDDITIIPTEADQRINRTLATINKDINLKLWQNAGYKAPPTIEQMIYELAEWGKR